ncbi:helix-turn-helix domain-containing protein [Rhodovulum tesquicola]|uniref:helix-turn-helix domain-containing protein n=1 Tax=Rhodovulum tesquicola TaxID=540254 RepID=UPI0033986200
MARLTVDRCTAIREILRGIQDKGRERRRRALCRPLPGAARDRSGRSASETGAPEGFGAILKRMREARGLTLAAAAEAAGIASARKLSHYETTCCRHDPEESGTRPS